MLKSGSWRTFSDGLGSYSFLPGEFDYFLTQRGIRREDVMKLPDLDVKALLEEHMDERRTGEDSYRRPALRAREENPQVPGRPIEPFGYTQAEAKRLAEGTATGGRGDRLALGVRVRRWSNTGGETTKLPSETTPVPPAERLRRSAVRLSDDDLADLTDALKQEQRRRKRSFEEPGERRQKADARLRAVHDAGERKSHVGVRMHQEAQQPVSGSPGRPRIDAGRVGRRHDQGRRRLAVPSLDRAAQT